MKTDSNGHELIIDLLLRAQHQVIKELCRGCVECKPNGSLPYSIRAREKRSATILILAVRRNPSPAIAARVVSLLGLRIEY